ncbi:hypothetical protein SAMN04488061_0088 [Filomicrobium insigne]|uniref:Uncharacterized protein n=1 Tax=Filomicrobium insigne TaxID=418854 RepID=A0A1H0G8R7_9HYPH|nr:hypothetical protein SAMN04488061_0088 [Filomicrobium insigne]
MTLKRGTLTNTEFLLNPYSINSFELMGRLCDCRPKLNSVSISGLDCDVRLC